MMRIHFLYYILLALFCLSWPVSSYSWARDRVLLSDVESLTLRKGSMTSYRRVPPILQLSCVGGDASGIYEVDVMRCENAGSDYDSGNVQWTCKATLPLEFKLGTTEVICEGYDSQEDPFVLKGSCGVEYTLNLTELGKKRRDEALERIILLLIALFPVIWKFFGETLSACFLVIAIGFVVWVVWRSLDDRRPSRSSGQGGLGGGGPNDTPPPPYSTPQERWRPGFWSGFLGGNATGYWAGSRRRVTPPPTRPATHSSSSSSRSFVRSQPTPSNPTSSSSSSSSANPVGSQPTPSSSSSSSTNPVGSQPTPSSSTWVSSTNASSSTPSSTGHRSTGFGSTTRR